MQTIYNYFLKRATVVYFLSLLTCMVLYSNHWMEWYWTLAGIIEVTGFVYLSSYLDLSWKEVSQASFERRLFSLSLILRLLWLIGFYLFSMNVWHSPWEQPLGVPMDSESYYNESLWIKEMILNKDLSPYLLYISGHIDDAGYPLFLGALSFITNNSIVLTRIPNIVFDSWTAVLIYRIANRNFDERVARVSGIFVVLMPMIIFFSGTTMKESMMLMLATWAVERGDFTIRNKSSLGFSFIEFILLAASLLLFRTALSWVLFLSFICALALSSERLITRPRRVVFLLILVFGGFLVGGNILEQRESLTEQFEATGANFEYRASRQGGNALVKGLSKAVLAPVIFSVPFPSMVSIEGQSIQVLQNGGYFLKNILSFFVIFALIVLVKRKVWCNNVMIIAFLLGYLLVLTLSSFAHSGRFHHPVIPIEMMFAVFGMSSIRNKRQADWFDYFLILEFLIIIVWNGFKLKGRGL